MKIALLLLLLVLVAYLCRPDVSRPRYGRRGVGDGAGAGDDRPCV